MESAVYLNPHFNPNHQSSYYRNDLYDYIEEQKETNLLILKRINRQNNFIYNQFLELHHLIATSQEQYAKFESEQKKLRNSLNALSNTAQANKRTIAQAAGISKNNSFSIQELIENFRDISKKANRIPMKMNYHFSNIDDKIAQSDKKCEEGLIEVIAAIKKAEDEISNRSSAELKELELTLSVNLKNTLAQIIEPLFSGLEEVTKKLELYLEETGKQPIIELFAMLNPGTKINKLFVSGASVQVASFIHFDQASGQVKFRMTDGNLLIANCIDIDAVEMNTKKADDTSKE